MSDYRQDLRERLAELAHSQWAGWMKYLFEKSVYVNKTIMIPEWAVDRWKRQTETAYADLPEEEKNSDRIEADKYKAVFESLLAAKDEENASLRAKLEKAEKQLADAMKFVSMVGNDSDE